jgi:hypothetical protein
MKIAKEALLILEYEDSKGSIQLTVDDDVQH